jgi:hypothetical protein
LKYSRIQSNCTNGNGEAREAPAALLSKGIHFAIIDLWVALYTVLVDHNPITDLWVALCIVLASHNLVP